MPGLNPSSKSYLLLVGVELDTFSILPPLVLGSTRGVPLPMPTTLVGALMRAVLTSPIEPEPEAVFEGAGRTGILYATFRPAPYAVTTTIEGGITLSYQRRERFRALRDATQCLDVLIGRMNFGFKLSRSKKEVIEYAIKKIEELIGHEVSKECIEVLVAVENLFSPLARPITGFGDVSYIAYIVTNPDLAKYAWGITRIGRKEDLAVVRDVRVIPLSKLKRVNSSIINTRFYVPASLVRGVQANGIPYNMRVYINGRDEEEPVYVPPPFIPDDRALNMQVVINGDMAVVYEVSTEEFTDYLVIPREVSTA